MLLGDGMPRAYSGDLRVRVIGAVEGGLSARGAGRRLGVGESTATAWVGRWRRTGSSEVQITEGPQPLATGGADELAIGANHSASRSHTGGDPRALGRARGSGGGEFDLAVLRPTRHQLKKNRARRGAAAPGCGEHAAPLEDRAPAET